MIYNQWGDPLKLLHKCQKVQPKNFMTPITPVYTFCQSTNSMRWYFAEFLKADNGLAEIWDTLKEVPAIELYQKDLRRIIKEAL